MTRVVCLRTGDKYGPEYVERLGRGVAQNTSRPFWFEVITQAQFPGWWQKLLVFPSEERTIFLDLDTVIVGNVDFLFDYAGPFCILRDFYRPHGYGSAVMSIAPGYGKEIRDGFLADADNIMRRLHGDQNWIEEQVAGADRWQDVAPGKIGSFKADALQESPKGFAVCCFHGQPRPHEVDGWVREAWR